MCGIIGCISNRIDREEFIRARDTLAHRGPDDAGYFQDEKAGLMLGHRRLSIIDLSVAGHQPMTSNCGRYTLVFNGEIYNYRELREELMSSYRFRTASDTEVILAAFSKWGSECVTRFNGMFAIALYDKQEGSLFCFRDHLGIKPFYYTLQPGMFAFASEIKGILALGVNRKANDAIIYDYLALGHYDHCEQTFFEGIMRLPAGCSMSVTVDMQVSISKYWDLEESKYDYASSSYLELQEKLRELLEDSIRLQLRSDVPVGVNISSGLDSSSLLFFAEQITSEPFLLFSMCYPGTKYDEGPFIKSVLRNDQVERWHKSSLSALEVPTLALKMNDVQDEPFGGIPLIAYLKMNALARDKQCTVLLEGQGVDEILAGYKYYIVEFARDAYRDNRIDDLRMCESVLGGLAVNSKAVGIKELLGFKTAARSQDMTLQLGSGIIAADFAREYEGRSDSFRVDRFDSDLMNAQYRDIRYTKLPRVLRFNDHVSMHYARELRVPYLDTRLVEFAFFLPAKYKMMPGHQKRILRDALSKVVPSQTRQREKFAFGAVQTPWLKIELRDWVMDTLRSGALKGMPYFNLSEIERQSAAFFDGDVDNSFFVWQLINMALWGAKVFN